MEQDSFRFLDPWTQLLPRRGGAVVAIAGSGGCTTLLLRTIEHLRTEGAHGEPPVPRLLVTQTTAHPVPTTWRGSVLVDPDERAAAEEAEWATPVRWVVGPRADDGTDRHAGLDPSRVEELARASAADVVLVQAHASSRVGLRAPSPPPAWPARVDLAILVAPLWAVGRPWGARVVEGADEELEGSGEPRRVSSADLRIQMEHLVSAAPPGARVLPFFTGFGVYRDIDGMFDLVAALWDPPAIPVVCLGELLGDERREVADRRGLAEDAAATVPAGERVYAVYPAELDGPEDAA